MNKAKFLIFVAFLTGTIFSQNISDVDFSVKQNGSIVISYSLVGNVSPRAMYKIWLEVSTDGGFTFDIKPRKVKGDVGSGIQGRGPKRILWEVLKEREELIADELVIKVKGKRMATISGMFMSLFVGNRLTKKRANGFSMYLGSRATAIYEDQFNHFVSEFANPHESHWNGGLKIVKLPFSFDLNFFADNYRLNPQWVENNTDYQTVLDNPTDVSLYHEGVALSANYAILPIFIIFYPTVGIGYETARFRIGEAPPVDETKYTHSAVSNSGLFAQIGLNLTLFRKYHLEISTKYVNGKLAANLVAQIRLIYHIPSKR